jgi:hypothetical protein
VRQRRGEERLRVELVDHAQRGGADRRPPGAAVAASRAGSALVPASMFANAIAHTVHGILAEGVRSLYVGGQFQFG